MRVTPNARTAICASLRAIAVVFVGGTTTVTNALLLSWKALPTGFCRPSAYPKAWFVWIFGKVSAALVSLATRIFVVKKLTPRRHRLVIGHPPKTPALMVTLLPTATVRPDG